MSCPNCDSNLKSEYDAILNKTTTNTITELKNEILDKKKELLTDLIRFRCSSFAPNKYSHLSDTFLTRNLLSKTDQEFFTIDSNSAYLFLCKRY